MKLRITLLMLWAVAAIAIAGAQSKVDRRIQEIRQAYADRLEIMKNNPYDDGRPFNEVSVDVAENMPGSGMHERHDKFYFAQEQYSAEGDMEALLYFATSTSTYAMGAHKWYWEFLWHAMEGDPMFALLVREEAGTKKEYRFYFDNGKVIKTVPELKQWPKKDIMSLHPDVIDKPADVLKLMNEKQAEFKRLLRK